MSNFQLEENVQNVISAIILKSPKVQTDLLYLRTVFIDSTSSLFKQINKLNKKQQKAKEKLKLNPNNHRQSPFSNTDPNFISQKTKQQRLKSPINAQKTPKNHQNSSDYSPDLMALILTQAKSIRTIFDSVVKSESQFSKHVQTSKLLNLYTVYKEFYKSFKQKHKQYIENYSYDEKHIHKNSTTMKHRLLEELKAQTQRRKELEEKLQALQEMMERSLLHKDKQLQKLNLKLVSLMKNNSNSGKKVFSCENCNNPLKVKEQGSQEESIQKVKKRNHRRNRNQGQNQDNYILGSISRQKQGQFYKKQDAKNHNHSKVSQTKQIQSKYNKSSQFSSQDQDSDEEQMCKSSTQKLREKKSNVGRFYNGNETIVTGKINETQSLIGQPQNTKDLAKDFKSNEKGQKLQGMKKVASNNEQRITFGQQAHGLMNKILPATSQFDGTKRSSSESPQKRMENQMNQLKQQLRKEKEEKIVLQKKIKQSDEEYKRLQSEVNELYKMINDAKFNEINNVQNSLTYEDSNKNQYNFDHTEDKKVSKDTNGLTSQDEKMTEKKEIVQKKIQKQMENFDDCEDYQDIINKAQRTILNESSLSPQEKGNKGLRMNSNSHFDMISPIKGSTQKSHERGVNKFVSPPKGSNLSKVSDKILGGLKQGKNSNMLNMSEENESNKNIHTIQSNLKQTSPINTKVQSNIPVGSINNEGQRELKIHIQKMQQFYQTKCKQKDNQQTNLTNKVNQHQLESDDLLMMLMLQSISIQQFIHKEKDMQENRNSYRNHFENDFLLTQ